MNPIRIRAAREQSMVLIEEISWPEVVSIAIPRFMAAITLKMFVLKIFCNVDRE